MARTLSRYPLLPAFGLAYAVLGFVLTFAFFAHLAVFLGNLPHPSDPWIALTVDSGATVEPVAAAFINLGLVALFGLQHSLMARPAFKSWWTRIVPAKLERTTYVIAAALAGFIMLIFWRPIPIVLWEVSGVLAGLLWTGFALGWLMLLASAASFGLFELLGVRQAWAWYRGEPLPQPELKTSWLYRRFSHPMYVGVILGLWMTPLMTVGHALIAAALTAYILIARRYEERDLSRTFGSAYSAWRRSPPGFRPRS